MGTRLIDRGLVAGALLLGAVVLAGALSHVSFGGHGESRERTVAFTTPVDLAPHRSIVVGRSDIELHGSPETEFLRRCGLDRTRLDVVRGQRLVIRYSGPPCQLPQLDLVAVVRGPGGRVLSRRPALAPGLPSILGGQDVAVSGALAPGLLRCWAGSPLALRTLDDGRVLRGTIRCRGQR